MATIKAGKLFGGAPHAWALPEKPRASAAQMWRLWPTHNEIPAGEREMRRADQMDEGTLKLRLDGAGDATDHAQERKLWRA